MINLENDNLLINKEVNQILENILQTKVFSNGYIFYGPEGIGKKQTAIEFIKEIFIQDSSNSNIQEKIIDNNHPDFLLIEPTYVFKGNLINSSEADSSKNKKATIRIEQIRNIKNFLAQKSIESGKKIVLIIDADLLNEAASNCLLKTLEEPTNGLFILLTSRLSSLLGTIISRCQLIRFKSFSYKQLEIFIKNNTDDSILNNEEKVNLEDLIYSANGSPGKILKNIKMWNELPNEIKDNLSFPLMNNLEILKVSKIIAEELVLDQQIFLVNLMQKKCWETAKNKKIIKTLEKLKIHLMNFTQPRLAWEVSLLKIANEDL
ncbi:DNA polymerase III, delta prime subunit [Prochlorococcus marinus str. MIT 9515]|uniref:DNA polymerase III, delta prime subunit n=1 Tax=Prochlorococcus marinus (strain MIT 9515) TaxID=167542 RepID=A2BUA5_PROM5|nr:DNA polymerase III subunit delta' [Prochlorococcus marinus]ABM71366.1 DNA polymerase III, delta prime subunit [Prochlorococcus marinus str. MIT 9515]